MALERALPVVAAGDDPELFDMRQRLRWSIVFTVPLVIIPSLYLLLNGWRLPDGSAEEEIQNVS
jgi:hypothetical protein